jgi:hypothetical protein
MSLLSDPQIIAAILTVLLTAIAAAAGYKLKERLAQITPFMAITGIEGDAKGYHTRVDIPVKVVKALEGAFVQSTLPERAQLPEVGTALSMAEELSTRGAELLDLMDRFVRAARAGDLASAQTLLAEVMIDDDFDHWITNLLGDRAVQVPLHDPSLPILIDCSEETTFRGGSFAVGFPGRGLRFGSELNEFTLFKSGVAALMELVRRMELPKLAQVVEACRTCIEKDIAIANEIKPVLEEISDKYSQWSATVFLANLGPAPLLVQTTGYIEILDRSGARYKQPAKLLILTNSDDGQRDRFEATSPLIVRSESDVTFQFCTVETQSEMSAGATVRALYRAGSAKCQVHFGIDRPGRKQPQILQTPPSVFIES